MSADTTPMDPKRAALESLYYDEAAELCDLVPLAEDGDDRMHLVHLAIMEALADAHEAGRDETQADITRALRERAATRRATADRMVADKDTDAALYYRYATAEECCAVLVEHGRYGAADAAKEQ